MSLVGDFSFGGPGAARFAQTRGRIQGGGFGVNYPSPFFDIAHTYLPVTVKQMLRWCRYYFLTNPVINAVVFKMSEYPITEIIIDHKDQQVVDLWTDFFQDHLAYRSAQVDVNLDYHAYGNSACSLGYPFKKYLTCRSCGFSEQAQKIRANWVFTNFSFRLNCPRCGINADAIPEDTYFRNASGIKLIRWNCENIEITYNDITGDSTYFYDIPPAIRNDVVIGKKDVVELIPQLFIQAMRQQKGIVFNKTNFFHMKRPTLAQQDRGWGIPLILPVLKDTFYLQIMKKAQEAILLEHIVPLRILFPQAGSGSSDPYCLDFSSLVETNYGYKPAGEVREGDIIKTVNGRYQPVTVVKKRAVKKKESVYRFTVAGMGAAPVGASEDHPFFAVQMNGKQKRRQQEWKPEWVKAKNLKVGDYVAYPISREVRNGMTIDVADHLQGYIATDDWIYRQITTEGAEVYEYVESRHQEVFASGELQRLADHRGWSVGMLQTTASRYRRGHRTSRMPRKLLWTKDLATILGYYLSEGCVDEGRITFSLHREETWICDELDAAFKNVLGLTGQRISKGENGLNYRISDSIFAEFLKNYGGHLAWNKKLPKEAVHLPEPILTELIRCLINGDGGAEQVVRDMKHGRPCRTTSVTYTTTSRDMALKLRELLLYIGVVGKVHTTPVRECRKHTIFRVKVNGQPALDLWKKLGWECEEKIVIEKDTTRTFIKGDYAFFRVRRKEELADVDFVYGFQVDGDKSFCVPACATHNTTINLMDWRDHVAAEIARWRMDPNYIPILPLPVGNQSIGGDGRALLMTQEMVTVSDQIVNGMQVPIEFIKGGLSYAGTNVSMRMLENQFIGLITRHRRMARWVMKEVANYMRWPEATIRFKPFKMADDIQRKAYLFQLNQAQKISDTTLLADSDMDMRQEDKIMLDETDKRLEATKKQQLAIAGVQAEAQTIMAKAQVKAQQIAADAQMNPEAPGEPGGAEAAGGSPGGDEASAAPPTSSMESPLNGSQKMAPANGQPSNGAGDIRQMAASLAAQIQALDPNSQQMALSNLQSQSPELADLVRQILSAQQQGGSGGGGPQVDSRPLPNQRPERRSQPSV